MVKLWVDGRRLAVTSFKVQHLVGAGWVSATKYEMNQKYRFRACFQNLFARGNIQMSNRDCELIDVYMTDFQVALKLPFAKFLAYTGDDHTYTLAPLMPGKVSNHPDFNNTLAPSTYRYFEFGDFIWMGPPTPVANAPVEVAVFHREIFHAGLPDAGRVIPNVA